MADILLATLNARWAHSAFGLRYLLANLGELRCSAGIAEFDISQRPLDVVEAILRQEPRIVGLGVYIWNVEQTTAVVADLKRIRPDITVVLGGPEISFETDQQEICRLADYIIAGEADLAFAALCREVLAGRPPARKVIEAPPPELAKLALPYDLYEEQDLARRVVYIEASRGCPFGCEFCLSSLDVPVRAVPLEQFLAEMQKLLDRGLRQFKFVDRTFNVNARSAGAILEFFLDRCRPGLFLHFEVIPDRLPEPLRELIARFPPGTLQFEVGIQTFNEEVAVRIGRRQDNAAAEANLRFLRERTNVHVHADLIVGLPGESVTSFAAGFDRLLALRPQEIQVGILKRLRGAPIARHDEQWGMVYSPRPPYEILQNNLIDFATMQRLRRFGRFWDLLVNSGNFAETAAMVWQSPPLFVVQPLGCSSVGGVADPASLPTWATPATEDRLKPELRTNADGPFFRFLHLADWLYDRAGRTHAIALDRLAELLFIYLTQELTQDSSEVAAAVLADWRRAGRSEVPKFLRPHAPGAVECPARPAEPAGPPRQSRHLGR